MTTEIILFLPALFICLILTGIHTYLGLHVLQREVVFVDIALGQVAALGMTVALLWDFPLESSASYGIAILTTFVASLFFSFSRDKFILQEAIIGVTFATSAALAILIADRLPHGGEHLKFILNGNILWVSWEQVWHTALIYFVLGFIHFFIRKKLILVSSNPLEAKKKGMKLWVWDLIFYGTFGIVITSSVQLGGILLVFSILIVPALLSRLIATSWKMRLVWGWVIGSVLSIFGLFISLKLDTPTGSTLVSLFGITLFVCILIRQIIKIKLLH